MNQICEFGNVRMLLETEDENVKVVDLGRDIAHIYLFGCSKSSLFCSLELLLFI